MPTAVDDGQRSPLQRWSGELLVAWARSTVEVGTEGCDR